MTTIALLIGAGILHLIPKLGLPGKAVAALLCRAPGLDIMITYFTALPMIVGPIVGGWPGLGGAILGQFAALILWTIAHELANPEARKGPRIVANINRKVGPVRNMIAVYWTSICVPIFWSIRVVEVFAWPVLIVLIRFPKYNQGEWVNCSRQKFQGLVGHDLIWCLYCDWMTGVWSLGTEMLRNVESFWCPIRFDSEKKCANCQIDFPDLNAGWVRADGTMEEVVAKLDEMYATTGTNTWFEHPARLTVKGEEIATR